MGQVIKSHDFLMPVTVNGRGVVSVCAVVKLPNGTHQRIVQMAHLDSEVVTGSLPVLVELQLAVVPPMPPELHKVLSDELKSRQLASRVIEILLERDDLSKDLEKYEKFEEYD